MQKKIYIYGKHAVSEALEHAPMVLRSISLSPKMDDPQLRRLIKESGVPVEPLDERKASSQVERNAPHQGIIALISLGELMIPFDKFISTFEATPDTSLVFLNEVQDPHNVGAVIRNAAAFGAQAILMPTTKQAPVTGAVVKASAGMAFRVPLISVENMQQAISQLKNKGMRVYGLAGNSKNNINDVQFQSPSLFIVGNEAQGIATAARALCDEMLSISISPRCESLNVAATSAIALYAWSVQHKDALK